MSTPAELYPGVDAAGDEPRAEVAALKGDLRMADVIARGGAQPRQRVPAPRRCSPSTASASS